MRKALILVTFVFLAVSIVAQPIRDEVYGDIHLTAGIYRAYPHAVQGRLTPAPEGKKPFYISHYGRYGSCFLSKSDAYEIPYRVLASADSLGKLTPLGHEVLTRLDRICQGARDRGGELTAVGATEQRDIVRRMVERFPEVFVDYADIDARSTTQNACILSMEYALLQLSMMKPRVKIHHNATRRDYGYLSQQSKMMSDSALRAVYVDYSRRYKDSGRLVRQLFNDTAYVNRSVDGRGLMESLFLVASNIQDTELCKRLTLYDLFTDEELFALWERENVWWFVTGGACAANGGQQPYTQCALLQKIIEQADKGLQQRRPSVSMRWGHEATLLPLVCLLDINGYGELVDNLESLNRRGWCNYKISPMSGNVQLVFYRNSLEDDDVLVKVLLNEDEATLPLKSDVAPYYHWREVREYYLNKLKNVII